MIVSDAKNPRTSSQNELGRSGRRDPVSSKEAVYSLAEGQRIFYTIRRWVRGPDDIGSS